MAQAPLGTHTKATPRTDLEQMLLWVGGSAPPAEWPRSDTPRHPEALCFPNSGIRGSSFLAKANDPFFKCCFRTGHPGRRSTGQPQGTAVSSNCCCPTKDQGYAPPVEPDQGLCQASILYPGKIAGTAKRRFALTPQMLRYDSQAPRIHVLTHQNNQTHDPPPPNAFSPKRGGVGGQGN